MSLPGAEALTILFSMRHAGALRNFASTIRELSRRGHQVHLVFMMKDDEGEGSLLPALVAEFPSITSERIKMKPHRWSDLARTVRSTADYVRYLRPEFAAARPLRKRAARYIPDWVRTRADARARRSPEAVTAMLRTLRAVEAALPPDPQVLRYLARRRPDVLLVTPLIDLVSDQVEYVKAARVLGIPSGLCVHSWDNLTNKGQIHAAPDRVFVWNGAQQREAATIHGIAPEHVIATGAPVFDTWFAQQPSTTREEFCRTVGLPSDKPFFLYLCSSRFIAATEADFIVKWIAAVRSAPDARVREAGLLIRPHPRTTLAPPAGASWTDFPNVSVWPPQGENPVDAGSKSAFFDSMYHAAAAIGINTTAQIEAGIVGRPVLSMRARDFEGTQEGSLHFQYLLRECGGLVRFDETLEAHLASLARVLDEGAGAEAQVRQFVEGFVRPSGLQTPATTLLADRIEELATLQPARAQGRLSQRARRVALYPLAIAATVAKRAARGSGESTGKRTQ